MNNGILKPQFIVVAKNQSPFRWLVLLLGCLMMIGPYYCFDIPAALKTQLKNRMGNPSDYEVNFNLLYTLYATPNVRILRSAVILHHKVGRLFAQVVLPFFGGYLVDRYGKHQFKL